MVAKTSFGQWLKRRRKVFDLTRDDLASRIGCAAVTITKIEADERRPSKQMAALLAEHLHIPPDEIATFINFARTEGAISTAPWGTPFHSPTNLLEQPTLLIGRDEDVTVISKQLLQPESRLLTFVGPPGIGKTRLALQVSRVVLDKFVDGVFFISLATINDADLVIATIANTLGIPDVGPQTSLERLKAFLRDKQTLLVLDNFEQILAAAPPIAELLAGCSLLKILVTSRAPLRIRQERQLPIAALALPDLAHLPDVETVAHYSAVTLFLERAQAVKPDFSLTEDNAPTVAAICTRLDGLPLAIELISARVKLLSPAALLERLHGRLMLQSDGLRDIEPRHRTLNAAIDWSYQLLSTEEQILFLRLGVFVGGWTLEAAEAICSENLNLNILDGLASLLDKNLIKQNERFTMLQTIREYALERLASSGEPDNLRQHHAEYFTAFAEHIEAYHARWANNMETEHDNLRAALAWGETGLRLAVALGIFWQQRGHLSEGSAWLTEGLMRQDIGTLTVADRRLRASAFGWLGTLQAWQGDLDAAQSSHEENVALFRELGDQAGLVEALQTYGMLFIMRGDPEHAGPPLEESLALAHKIRDAASVAQSLFFSGILEYLQGYVQQASALWEESLALRRPEGNQWFIAIVLAHLAMAAIDESNYRRATSQLAESLTLLRTISEKWQTAHTLEVIACLAAMQGHFLRAAHIFGAARRLREIHSIPMLSFLQKFYERGVATLRAQLDEATLATAWAEGRAMTLEQVVAYALQNDTSPTEIPLIPEVRAAGPFYDHIIGGVSD